MGNKVVAASKQSVLSELEEPIADLYNNHVKVRGELWMPSEIIFTAGAPREDRIAELRDAAQRTPPALRVIYALHLLTEEALPTSFHLLTQGLGFDSVLKAWVGRWTAEEDRHGQLMLKLADVSGMIPDTAGFERWRFKYIEAGFGFPWEADPYCLLAYTAAQEEATRVSHANLSVLLKQAGAQAFAEPLGRIAAEENFHARFYRAVVKLVFERDPDRMLCALWTALGTFEMPGMTIPQFPELSYLSERHGTLTPGLIADTEEKLLRYWGVPDIEPECQAASEAKDGLLARLAMLRDKQQQLDAKKPRTRTFNFPFLREPFKA